MTEITFFVPGRPFSKRRPRTGRGVVYTHPETVAAEKAVAFYARRATGDQPPLTGAVEIDCVFLFAITASWSARRKAATYGGPYVFKPDVDNLLKLVLDALNPKKKDAWGVWKDDGQVALMTSRKRWCDVGEEEGTFVRITEII